MSTGFSFGATTGAPSFGAAPSGQLGFSMNPQQQQPQQTGFQFGATTTKPAAAAAPQPLGFSLGAQTTGFSFGAPATTSAQNTGFNFGAPQTAATNLTFGGSAAPITSTSAALSFGAAPAFGASTTTAAPLFGATSSSAPAFSGLSSAAPSFGTPASSAPVGTTTLSFGAPASTSTGFSLGGLGTTTTSSGFSLGTTTTPSLGLSFGTTPATTQSTGLAFGCTPLTFALPTATTTSLSFGPLTASTTFSLPTETATSQPAKIGLGGVQTTSGAATSTKAAQEIPPKEQQVPNEIQQDIENFKNYIKQQKQNSSDVSRCCVKDYRSVEAEVTQLSATVKEIQSQLTKNRGLAEKLKYDTAQGLQLLEMAQRTQDTPAGLQYENVAPMHYFLSLADKFERDMQALKMQIENMDKYVKNCDQPATLTSQDLTLGMRRLHDTFVALAGRLQSVHTQVETQKEQYINLRKQLANDYTNPFETIKSQSSFEPTANPPIVSQKIACGPTPFNQATTSSFPMTTQQNVPGFPSGLGTSSGLTSFLGSGNTSAFQNTTFGSSLQLQKPPSGNKRGKQ